MPSNKTLVLSGYHSMLMQNMFYGILNINFNDFVHHPQGDEV